MHNKIFDIFVRYKKVFENLDVKSGYINLLQSNGVNLFVYPDVPFDIDTQVKRSFNLLISEILLLVYDISLEKCYNRGMVITDRGLLFIKDEGDEIRIHWNEIDYVEACNSNICFYTDCGGENKLLVDFSDFVKNDLNVQAYAILFAQLFTKMAKAYVVDEEFEIKNSNDNEFNFTLKENADFEENKETIRKYPKEEIEQFKEQYISKVKKLIILWSIMAFICLLIGGFMIIFSIIFAIPAIVSFFVYLSFIDKDDASWEREYSKLWKNMSNVDKLKTVGRVADVIFKLFE